MTSLDVLDTEQKEALSQFQAVTQSDNVEDAISKLEEYNWNLERAVQSVYEIGSRPEATRENLEEQVATDTDTAPLEATNENEQIPEATTRPAPSTPRQAPRPRQPSARTFRLFSFLVWPFGIAWQITWAALSFASRFLGRSSITTSSSSPRRSTSTRNQDPQVLANEFLSEYEEKYGTTHPTFFQGGYSQALEVARRELRFLWVILQCDDHDATPKFCSEILSSDELSTFLNNNNILVWGGNVRNTEANRVSNTLHATTYPFAAAIALQPPVGPSASAMTVLERFEGFNSPADLIAKWEAVLQRHGGGLNRLKMERDQRDLERRLRQEQDKAYHDSLKADQEKERKAREEREAEKEAEKEAERLEQIRLDNIEKRLKYIRYLSTKLEDEPSADYEGKVARLSFRLGNGDRVIRKFKADLPIEAIYEFVEAYPLLKEYKETGKKEENETPPTDYVHKYKFTIISPYPRKVYDVKSDQTLMDDKSLYPSANLIVDTEEEEED
ncbi:hypothetical protein J3Q64DRAFT_1823780 [Phycomyces blakesleeanus]|uniref:UBX domain-containing protein n=2 Tax=Phycomyces blakesleeanus TaxID=4837 RepID=A0A167RDI3_PHYB8|nr:hypothetical protein PHYBLDRAFT_80064 [Phycomyces blakesleeanus NRRL 1555(-)]OAD81408.1 hypothetical protein PHYBLDRAFT_80064 [Phycomyces blakesleeanus NRRL 1555(-)]|eukprot:XP_018299448.1 hypothetical protein PHYBLDRAFT_80064 [Phycomyces blakesleeanus NRRL 1555(-)]